MSESEPTKVPQAPLVSVVIPAHNADATLARCLTALNNGTVAPLETIVVCDGCEDRTEQVARSFAGVRVIRNDRRRGAGYSRNAGVAIARGDILFFVDADCVPAPDMVERGLRALADERAVFGSYGPETSAPGFWTRFKNYQHHFTHQNGAPYQASFWTGCGAVTPRGLRQRRRIRPEPDRLRGHRARLCADAHRLPPSSGPRHARRASQAL